MYHAPMKHASQTSILDALHARGYRITAPRRAIVEALLKAPSPFTIQDVVAQVTGADQVSVYRLCKVLQEEKIIETVPSVGEALYEFKSEHHHHVICEGCGVTAHVPCESVDTKKAQKAAAFSKITHHEVTLYGLCNACV